EVADRVRGDLVPARAHVVDEGEALLHLVGGAAEIDVGGAAALVRPLIGVAPVIGEVVDAADEEGEMDAVAVLVQLGSEVRQLLPALELGAIVEGNGDELRRALDGERRQREGRGGKQENERGGFHAARSNVSATVESALRR